jgi:HAD superfamily hydrolase (TIGR01509 family)
MPDTPAPIKAILFDLMGVLLFVRGDYPGDPALDAVDDMIGGVVDDALFRRTVMERMQFDEDAFQNILARIPEKYEPYTDLWRLLPAMRIKYKIGILNNGTRLTFPSFDAKLKFTDRFDLILSSGAEGVRKPDAEIYLRACAQLSVEPRDCLFMDDSEANINGARAVGMQTIRWKNREEGLKLFKERLEMEGIHI